MAELLTAAEEDPLLLDTAEDDDTPDLDSEDDTKARLEGAEPVLLPAIPPDGGLVARNPSPHLGQRSIPLMAFFPRSPLRSIDWQMPSAGLCRYCRSDFTSPAATRMICSALLSLTARVRLIAHPHCDTAMCRHRFRWSCR